MQQGSLESIGLTIPPIPYGWRFRSPNKHGAPYYGGLTASLSLSHHRVVLGIPPS